jgi:exodeoxyribonuclease VII large subunit
MKVLQVSEFLEIVNGILRETLSGEEIAVEGEVSGYRVSQGQWVSFDLKDDRGLVNVFLPLWQLTIPVEDGLRVRVVGLPRIYPKYGKFSLSAERIEYAGEGELRKALIQLRARLEKEGLFDPSRKRELPRFPQRIALIASRESAAYGDFIRVLSERWGGIEIDLYHVIVQGDKAPPEIVAAIHAAQSESYDALVLTRGGGSFEEMMAFNDERVVRAIHGSKIPTLVAIGHERDISLAEEVADVRGSTPTDCARRLVPDRKDILYELAAQSGQITERMQDLLDARKQLLAQAVSAPELWLAGRVSEFHGRRHQVLSTFDGWFSRLQERTVTARRLLTSFDPKQVLARGYAILHTEKGTAITSVKTLKPGDLVKATFKDGQADLLVDGQRVQPRLL